MTVRNERDATVFDNWRSNRAIANNRMPFCSYQMKHEPCRKWLKANATDEDIYVVGIGWDEIHRLPAIERGWSPNKVIAPMTEPPYLDKRDVINWANSEGLTPPRLYSFGFAHANCGGGCVRAGLAHWKHLYQVMPEVFAKWEAEEKAMRQELDKDISILRDRRGGESKPFPLSQLRQEIENNGQLDLFDWGGCGCFSDGEP